MHEDEVMHILQSLIKSLKVRKDEKFQIKISFLDSLMYDPNFTNCVQTVY